MIKKGGIIKHNILGCTTNNLVYINTCGVMTERDWLSHLNMLIDEVVHNNIYNITKIHVGRLCIKFIKQIEGYRTFTMGYVTFYPPLMGKLSVYDVFDCSRLMDDNQIQLIDDKNMVRHKIVIENL